MPKAARILRIATLVILLSAIATGVVLLFTTETGNELINNHKLAGEWVRAHRVIAPAVYVGVYVLLVMLMLPVWWLQILAGYGFGLIFGVVWSQIAATIGSVGAMLISRFIAADWFHEKVESRLERLRTLNEKMGHNGLLVVMAVRLMHFIPIGASNYLFGLTTITTLEVAVGTLIGGIPTVAAYVGGGAGYHPWSNWRFLAVLLALNVLMLVPLALRYLKPEWFKKVGIE